MTTAILDRPVEISGELMGPYMPPTADEILPHVCNLEPSLKESALLALGEAAVGVHAMALERSVLEGREVEIPSVVVDARIAGEYGVNKMVKARRAAGRMLSAGFGEQPLTYSIAPYKVK